MPAAQGVLKWPSALPALTALVEELDLPLRSRCPPPQASPDPTGDNPSLDDSPPIQRPLNRDDPPIRHPILEGQPVGRPNLDRLPRPIPVDRDRRQPNVHR